jgi:hypothetical protein
MPFLADFLNRNRYIHCPTRGRRVWVLRLEIIGVCIVLLEYFVSAREQRRHAPQALRKGTFIRLLRLVAHFTNL